MAAPIPSTVPRLCITLIFPGTKYGPARPGFIDTDLTGNIDAPKSSPDEIVRTTFAALERGDGQILADEISSLAHRGLSADHPAYFQSTAAFRSRAGLVAR